MQGVYQRQHFIGRYLFHVYTNHDSSYSVTAISYNACGTDTASRQLVVSGLGIAPLAAAKTRLFPGPVSAAVNLDCLARRS